MFLRDLQWQSGIPLTICKVSEPRGHHHWLGGVGEKPFSGGEGLSLEDPAGGQRTCNLSLEEISSSKMSKSSMIEDISIPQKLLLEWNIAFSTYKYKVGLYLFGVYIVCSFGNDTLQSWTAIVSLPREQPQSSEGGFAFQRRGGRQEQWMRELLPWNLDVKTLAQFTNQWLEVTDLNLETLASLRRKI